MIVCDAHPNERATTTIRLPSGRTLTFCGHHTRIIIEQLINIGQDFTLETNS